jgi:hypothetical protein
MRASIAAVRGGTPSVAIVGSHFKSQALSIERSLGVQNSGLAVYPGHIRMDGDAEFRRKVATDIVDQIIAGLTRSRIEPVRKRGEFGLRDIVFRGGVDEVNDHFYDNLWTEGLPVIPPTIHRVDAFMRYTKRLPDEVIGVLLPEKREATVWNVAVNGVMAGCKPDYMPLLLALVEAVADPDFRIEDHGSTPGWEPLIIASGPVIQALDFNTGIGVMRAGRRANTAIGRFLRLYTRNIAGLRIPPGETDRAGVGNPFNVVLAENEAFVRSIGWPTFGMERGLAAGESGVTVQSMLAASAPLPAHGFDGTNLEAYLDALADNFGKTICGYWVHTAVGFAAWHPLIIMNPQIARLAAEKGWSKNDVRQYLYERARIPVKDIELRGTYINLDLAAQLEKGIIPSAYGESKDPDRLVPVFYKPEAIGIVVAGNPATTYTRGYMNNHEQGAAVTRRIAMA